VSDLRKKLNHMAFAVPIGIALTGALLPAPMRAAAEIAGPVAGANTLNQAQGEIEHLLSVVQNSGCEFYRNGNWYGAPEAQAHLREKLQLLTVHAPMGSAEEFIDKVATRSVFTNLAYEVRCRDGAAVAVNVWLQDQLKRYRELSRKPAS
jgi:hypothetical protein